MGSVPVSSKISARYSQVHPKKSGGATYTPSIFAAFVADQIAQVTKLPESGRIRILDPSVGDGTLLLAMIERLPEGTRKRLEVFGFDTDPIAVASSASRIQAAFPSVPCKVEQRDFLEYVLSSGDGLFAEQQERFDLVIANPPYVRTQIIGAKQARGFAEQFGLSGRVDLCFPFLLGISQVLSAEGTFGIIVSNRFMTTKAGQSVRRALLSRFDLLHVWDMGDTKLFDAAVLPAVLLGHNATGKKSTTKIPFSTIYEEKTFQADSQALHTLEALSFDSGVVGVSDGRRFKVTHGTLDNGKASEGVWRIATNLTDTWLATVESHTWATFSRIGRIRVGVKTTADKVFINTDWESVSSGQIPELLRPLTTRKCSRRFKPIKPVQPKMILYPHESTPSGRAPVDLNQFPKAARYLESHRQQLEARTYVIEAGRKWYEIWVHHDPATWAEPKMVFPDISEKPSFWIDLEGTVVNGECYWIRCEDGSDPDLLWLAVGIANSAFIESFYDHRFNNKLYAGRRRFITQYVEKFPLPDPGRPESQAIIATAKKIYDLTPSREAENLGIELNNMVWRVFGLPTEEVTR